MTGVRMTFGFNDKVLRKELRDRVDKLENREALLKSIGEEMLPRITKRFKTERGPDGKRWAPLSSRTVEARLKRYGNSPLTILRMRGHLAGSINYQVGGTTLKIGTDDSVSDYAGIHQFGGKAGRGKKVTIKARPYLGFSEDDLDVLDEEIDAFLSAT